MCDETKHSCVGLLLLFHEMSSFLHESTAPMRKLWRCKWRREIEIQPWEREIYKFRCFFFSSCLAASMVFSSGIFFLDRSNIAREWVLCVTRYNCRWRWNYKFYVGNYSYNISYEVSYVCMNVTNVHTSFTFLFQEGYLYWRNVLSVVVSRETRWEKMLNFIPKVNLSSRMGWWWPCSCVVARSRRVMLLNIFIFC